MSVRGHGDEGHMKGADSDENHEKRKLKKWRKWTERLVVFIFRGNMFFET